MTFRCLIHFFFTGASLCRCITFPGHLLTSKEFTSFSLEQVYAGVLHFPAICSPQKKVRRLPMVTNINLKSKYYGQEKYSYNPSYRRTIRRRQVLYTTEHNLQTRKACLPVCSLRVSFRRCVPCP